MRFMEPSWYHCFQVATIVATTIQLGPYPLILPLIPDLPKCTFTSLHLIGSSFVLFLEFSIETEVLIWNTLGIVPRGCLQDGRQLTV